MITLREPPCTSVKGLDAEEIELEAQHFEQVAALADISGTTTGAETQAVYLRAAQCLRGDTCEHCVRRKRVRTVRKARRVRKQRPSFLDTSEVLVQLNASPGDLLMSKRWMEPRQIVAVGPGEFIAMKWDGQVRGRHKLPSDTRVVSEENAA